MKKILVFRTDRIGDFLISTPLFSSIKRNFKNCEIDIVCSKLNYEYVKSFNFFNKVFLYPSSFIKKISFYFSLKKYDLILVADGKKRSIYSTILKSSNNKYLFTPSLFIKKYFKIFFNRVFFINYEIPKIDIIKNFLNEISCDFKEIDKNFLIFHENKSHLDFKIPVNNYIVLNFDEKWLFDKYLNTYRNIEPEYIQFLDFLLNLSKKSKIVITNGFIDNPILAKLKLDDKRNFFNEIIIKDKINIFELQNLIKHSDCLISCHGAPSHIGSNYNIKVIDIVDISEKNFFESYNHHFNKKVQIFRENFVILSKKIINAT